MKILKIKLLCQKMESTVDIYKNKHYIYIYILLHTLCVCLSVYDIHIYSCMYFLKIVVPFYRCVNFLGYVKWLVGNVMYKSPCYVMIVTKSDLALHLEKRQLTVWLT